MIILKTFLNFIKTCLCLHESTKWVGRGGLENAGIQVRICETYGKKIEARYVYR